MRDLCAAEHLEDMGLQALLTGTYANPSAAAAAIDGVTASSVQSVSSQVSFCVSLPFLKNLRFEIVLHFRQQLYEILHLYLYEASRETCV